MDSSLITACSVPTLLRDVEDDPIHPDNYKEFTDSLEFHQNLLLDFVCNPENAEILLNQEDSEVNLQKRRLLMLMCEHAPIVGDKYPPYALKRDNFWRTLQRSCDQFSDQVFLTQCLEMYKEKLLNKKWRKDLGSSHGFVKFSEIFFTSREIIPDLQTILFVLSIASQFIDCVHGEVKLLGLRLYEVILRRCPGKVLLESNVHRVVIKNCLDNSQKLLNEDCLILLWSNVAQGICMNEEILKDLNWNELDDSLLLLFQKIKTEGKREMRHELRKVLTRIINTCYGHSEEFPTASLEDLQRQQELIQRERKMNVKLFRWTGDLKELFIFECLSTTDRVNYTLEALMFICSSYLWTMHLLPGNVIKPTLEDMTKRLTPLLLEIYKIYRENEEVKSMIKYILEILLSDLRHTSPVVAERSPHHQALEKLITNHLEVN